MSELLDPMGYGQGYGQGYGYGGGYGAGYGMPGTMPGNVPGTVPGTMQRNMPGSMHGNMPGSRRPDAMMRINESLIGKIKNHEAKKEKAIEQILAPEQKILFKQLKDARHKELERLLEKIRENRSPR